MIESTRSGEVEESKEVEVKLEIQAAVSNGSPNNVVRSVTEDCRTLIFSDHGSEK